MSARFVLITLAVSLFGFLDADSAVAKSGSNKQIADSTKHASGKSKTKTQSHKRKRNHRAGIAARLIPPPPAYMPSILPELYYHKTVAAEEVADEEDEDGLPAKPKNPYQKYFYSRDNEVPKAVQARSGVSTWTPPTR